MDTNMGENPNKELTDELIPVLQPEPDEQPITDDKRTIEITEIIGSLGLDIMQREHGPGAKQEKHLHTADHPITLEKRASAMYKTFGFSISQRAITKLAIDWHDTVIQSDPADPNKLLAMIKRHRGAREGDLYGIAGNEAQSAEKLKKEMCAAEIYTEEEIAIATFAIEATYPEADLGKDYTGAVFADYKYYQKALQQNPALASVLNELAHAGVIKGPHFSQPHLERQLEDKTATVPKEALVVALADLGAAGVAESGEFFKEGDNEMKELYGNLLRPEVIWRLRTGDEPADAADRALVVKTLLNWLDSQPGFATWQALRFEKIIFLLKEQGELTEIEETGLRAQFNRYPDNIRATRTRAISTRKNVENTTLNFGEKAAFNFLIKELGYIDKISDLEKLVLENKAFLEIDLTRVEEIPGEASAVIEFNEALRRAKSIYTELSANGQKNKIIELQRLLDKIMASHKE